MSNLERVILEVLAYQDGLVQLADLSRAAREIVRERQRLHRTTMLFDLLHPCGVYVTRRALGNLKEKKS